MHENGWGGFFGPDDNLQGVFADGPQPARSPLARLVKSSEADTTALPVPLAKLALTRAARIERRLLRMLHRARLTPVVASLPPEQAVKRRLAPLRVGRG
jgi:hypothetical protein